MTEDEFFRYLEHHSQRYKKLCFYEEFVKEKLSLYPQTGSAQMHDWLKEHNDAFPSVCPKTVFNFVQYVRQKYNIPQQSECRQFFPVEETEYGQQAQVDFGQSIQRMPDGGRTKVYFMAMVLSRSRQKFVWFSIIPFTTKMAIEAHERAFAYFEGIPREIVYDQDKVFLSNENKGNLLLTKDFSAYTAQVGFRLHFCRKADPQSKGKIENVVKYVKQNFLYNRTFIDLETLSDQAANWLSRTANISKHHRTQKVPFYEWHTEKTYLKAYTPSVVQYDPYTPYNVRKDNTIAYKGNYYTLPQGSYKSNESQVLVRIENTNLCAYTPDHKHICTHPLSYEKGKTIRNTNHKRDNSSKINDLIDQVVSMFDQPDTVKTFVKQIHKVKPRYIRDQLTVIRHIVEASGVDATLLAIAICIQNDIYDAMDLKEIVQKQAAKTKTLETPTPLKLLTNVQVSQIAATQPLQSNIADYQKLMIN